MPIKQHRPIDRSMIGIWLTYAERILIERAAAADDRSLAAWCRAASLKAARKFATREAEKATAALMTERRK